MPRLYLLPACKGWLLHYFWRNCYERIVSLLLWQMRILRLLPTAQKRSLSYMQSHNDTACHEPQRFYQSWLWSQRRTDLHKKRITAPEKLYHQRKLVGALTQHIIELEKEIQTLNETVEWMHATIWAELRKKQALKEEIRRLKALITPDQKEHWLWITIVTTDGGGCFSPFPYRASFPSKT